MRSALGYEWHFDMSAGPKPYLCSADLQDLRETIDEFCSIGTSMDANDVIEEAYRLKTARILKAILFLSKTKSYFSVDQIRENGVEEPTRQWINGVLNDLNSHIINRRAIDPKRLESCSFDTIHSFFSQFGQFIQSFAPELTFGADETMLKPTVKSKAVVPKNIKILLEDGLPEMHHITAMLAHSVNGIMIPPFIYFIRAEEFTYRTSSFCK